MAALWGGVTPPREKDEVKQYLRSLDYFMKEAKNKNVDVALSNHTSLDNGLERIAYSKERMEYMPNIYIVGWEGFQRYCHCLLYTSPSPRDPKTSRMPSSA